MFYFIKKILTDIKKHYLPRIKSTRRYSIAVLVIKLRIKRAAAN